MFLSAPPRGIVSELPPREVALTGLIGRTQKGATIAVGMIFILLFGGSPFTGEPEKLEADSTKGEDMFTP